MVEIIKRITKIGDGYGILLPKALIDCKVFEKGEYLKVNIDKVDNIDWAAADPREKVSEGKPLKKTSLEPRRALGPMLSLVRAPFSVLSLHVAKEWPLAGV